jgi:hypothetical protein
VSLIKLGFWLLGGAAPMALRLDPTKDAALAAEVRCPTRSLDKRKNMDIPQRLVLAFGWRSAYGAAIRSDERRGFSR